LTGSPATSLARCKRSSEQSWSLLTRTSGSSPARPEFARWPTADRPIARSCRAPLGDDCGHLLVSQQTNNTVIGVVGEQGSHRVIERTAQPRSAKRVSTRRARWLLPTPAGPFSKTERADAESSQCTRPSVRWLQSIRVARLEVPPSYIGEWPNTSANGQIHRRMANRLSQADASTTTAASGRLRFELAREWFATAIRARCAFWWQPRNKSGSP
jgi:hypothetical protein